MNEKEALQLNHLLETLVRKNGQLSLATLSCTPETVREHQAEAEAAKQAVVDFVEGLASANMDRFENQGR